MLLYSSEFNWSSQPWRILKCPSMLASSVLSGGEGAGWRGPKSLLARTRLGRAEDMVAEDGLAAGAVPGDACGSPVLMTAGAGVGDARA